MIGATTAKISKWLKIFWFTTQIWASKTVVEIRVGVTTTYVLYFEKEKEWVMFDNPLERISMTHNCQS